MKFKSIIAPLALAAAILVGCQESAEYKPVIYMTDAQAISAKVVPISEAPGNAPITVSASEVVGRDTRVTLELRPDLVAEYNAKYGKNYVALPQDSYSFPETEAVIPAGFLMSSTVNLTVTSIADFQEGTTYCMPVSIKATDGSMPVLEPSRTVFIVFRTPVISKATYLGTNYYDIPKFQTTATLSAVKQLTLECRVYVDKFATSDPFISSIMGIEGICAVRFGDVKIPNNVLQICHENYQPAATANPFDTKKWYHVAAVWTGNSWDIYIDGKFATGAPTAGESINLTSDNSGGFHLGKSYGSSRYLYGYIAEARVWTRALNVNELANNMNYIDPKSPGLLAYWRMNAFEASDLSGYGNVVRDLTGNGYDAYGKSASPQLMDTKWD